MTSSRKELRDASSVKAGFRQTEGGTQTRASGSYDDRIILVVLGVVNLSFVEEYLVTGTYNDWILL